MTDCKKHPNHEHNHGDNCGHTKIKHGDHYDYLHDGHLHHNHQDHVDEHFLEVSDMNPPMSAMKNILTIILTVLIVNMRPLLTEII